MSDRRVNGHLASTGVLVLILGLPLFGCAGKPAETVPAPATASRRAVRVQAAVKAEQDRRISRLELALLEKTAQVEELQGQLDEAREEVVRAMAKLQTLASRAEAASGMAEAEVALQPLKVAAPQSSPEAAQAKRLLGQSS